MTPNFFFRCINTDCGGEFDPQDRLYQCPECGDLMDLEYNLEEIDGEKLKKKVRDRRGSNHPLDISGVWRFRELLPFQEKDHHLAVTLGEGNAPVLDAPNSSAYIGLSRLRVKHLGWNPTGSFKDYGMTTSVTQACKLGVKAVACASTGNTSASMAAYSARAKIRGIVFIPEGHIAHGKLSQTMEFGAQTVQIEGNFDVAMRMVRELAATTDLYLLNSINPYRVEGQKTVIMELLDQLDWQVPDRIVLPGGNLGNTSSLGKGLMELKRIGLIKKVPRLTTIQASGASPLHSMLSSGRSTLQPVMEAQTQATAIKIGSPVSWKKAVRALEFSDGWCDSVNEEEIANAKAVLGRDGLGCEPASATTVAGLRKLIDKPQNEDQVTLHPDEDVVAILTGHQLKDSEYTVKYHLGNLDIQDIPPDEDQIYKFSNPPIRIPADRGKIVDLLGL